MISKTQGIVLSRIKYSDNKIIVNIFTRCCGKKSFIVFKSANKKHKTVNFFQPLFVLDLELSEKPNKNFAAIKDVSISKPYKTITVSPEKMAIVFFITEILDKTIEDQLVDSALFDFLTASFFLLDSCSKPANFHIAFLAAYSIFIGIMPENNFSEHNKFFDIRKGNFRPDFFAEYSMNENLSFKFSQILNYGISSFQDVKLNRIERNLIVTKIINFYAYNFIRVNNLKSIKVLTEIFND